MSEMRQRALASELYRNLRILAVLTVVFLLVLALAPFKWHNTEWREIQEEYNDRAAAVGQSRIPVALQQIWRPEVGITDRCTSCHLGMGAARPLERGGVLFGRHPQVGHDVARMGCTVCHRGQGRATTGAAAHGKVAHWEDPMLPGAHLEASCGGCHGDAAAIPPLTQVERGEYLFQFHGCQACHVVDGEGGTVGPDLSGVALKGFDREWHVRHLREPASMVEGSRMMSFGHLSDREIDALLAYLDTLIGAPRLIRGKAIAVSLGCRGCHKIGGLGGDVSVDLNAAAAKPLGDYDFSGVQGPHDLETWHREHLRDPALVAPGSTMPAYRLEPADEDALVTFILSLRRPDVAMEALPRDAVLARLQERRDFPLDGAEMYGVFCSACHGSDGRGRQMASLGTIVPDLRNPATRAVLSPSAMRYTVEHGRPGRFMPAWGPSGAGLRDEELDAILGWLAEGLPRGPTFAAVRDARPDPRHGGHVFRNDCAACHGSEAQGTVIGPSLNTPELAFAAGDEYLYRMIVEGRAGTAMPAHRHYDARTVRGLIAWLRNRAGDRPSPAEMTRKVRRVLGVESLEAYRASGSPAYGRLLFESMCVSCHGPAGRGGIAPAIGNPAFLRAATDGFIAGNIVLGRSGRAMRSFGERGLVELEGREIGDVIAYLRSVASEESGFPAIGTVQGELPVGKALFGSYCSGCHGAEGAGRTAPALRNPEFLNAVSDGFLQATIVRGRPGTAMRAWGRGGFGFGELEPEEINHIVAYIRSWQTGS